MPVKIVATTTPRQPPLPGGGRPPAVVTIQRALFFMALLHDGLRPRERRMSIVGFHKILIATAILFCTLFAAWQGARFLQTRSPGDALLGIVFVVLAALLGLYLSRLERILGRGSP